MPALPSQLQDKIYFKKQTGDDIIIPGRKLTNKS